MTTRTEYTATLGAQQCVHYVEDDLVPTGVAVDTPTEFGVQLVHPETGEVLASSLALKPYN